MTPSNPSSLALPDSPPNLPEEIEREILTLHDACVEGYDSITGFHDSLNSLRSVIAKHLLTAEEARRILDPRANVDDIVVKLQRISGSSRGEE